jgi:hypothetical protein
MAGASTLVTGHWSAVTSSPSTGEASRVPRAAQKSLSERSHEWKSVSGRAFNDNKNLMKFIDSSN